MGAARALPMNHGISVIHRAKSAFSSVLLWSGLWILLVAFHAPPLTGPVVDQADMISPEARSQLTMALKALYDRGGTQIAVLTLPQLDGLSIEQASIAVADFWKLGREHKDDGILLLIARQERAIRIEVGRGREGDLTDLHARRIIDNVMVPRFRAGDVDGAIIAGVKAVVGRTDPGVDLDGLAELSETSSRGSRGRGSGFVFLLIVVVVILKMMDGGSGGPPFRRRRSWSLGSSSYGSYKGRNGNLGGSGGWSGGGGGFSGGGASGRW